MRLRLQSGNANKPAGPSSRQEAMHPMLPCSTALRDPTWIKFKSLKHLEAEELHLPIHTGGRG